MVDQSAQSPLTIIHRLTKNRTRVAIALTIIALIVAGVLTVLTPDTPDLANLKPLTSPLPAPSITSLTNDVIPTTNLTFVGEEPTLPESFVIYRSEYTADTTQNILRRLAEDYSLSAIDKTSWTNQDGGTQMVYLADEGLVILNSPLSETQTTTFSTKLLTTETQSFMKKYLQENPPQSFEYMYLHHHEGDVHLELEDDPNAYYAYVYITPTYSSLPVRFQNHSNTENFVVFNTAYQPVQFTLTPELYSAMPIGTVEPMSFETALENIKAGSYTVVDSYNPFETSTDAAVDLNSTTFTSAELEYRLDPSTDLYTPYYHFYGTMMVSFADGQREIEVITPAVELAR